MQTLMAGLVRFSNIFMKHKRQGLWMVRQAGGSKPQKSPIRKTNLKGQDRGEITRAESKNYIDEKQKAGTRDTRCYIELAKTENYTGLYSVY